MQAITACCCGEADTTPGHANKQYCWAAYVEDQSVNTEECIVSSVLAGYFRVLMVDVISRIETR